LTESAAVFDASVFVRALADERGDAVEWIRRAERRDVVVSVPALVDVEIANALAGYVRAGALTLGGAIVRLEFAQGVPRSVRAEAQISSAALGLAVERGLSVYDATYVVLAEAERALLVTADAALAAATDRAELLP
jgi:predicted nucleic acid-binding protein